MPRLRFLPLVGCQRVLAWATLSRVIHGANNQRIRAISSATTQGLWHGTRKSHEHWVSDSPAHSIWAGNAKYSSTRITVDDAARPVPVETTCQSYGAAHRRPQNPA